MVHWVPMIAAAFLIGPNKVQSKSSSVNESTESNFFGRKHSSVALTRLYKPDSADLPLKSITFLLIWGETNPYAKI